MPGMAIRSDCLSGFPFADMGKQMTRAVRGVMVVANVPISKFLTVLAAYS